MFKIAKMAGHDDEILSELRRKFESAAKELDGVQYIVTPEIADLVVLLANEKHTVDELSLHEILVSKQWETKSFTWKEICELDNILNGLVQSSLVLAKDKTLLAASDMTLGLGEVVASEMDISSDTVSASLVVNEVATFVSCTSSSGTVASFPDAMHISTAKVMRQTQQDNDIRETLVANYDQSKLVPLDYKATSLETSERSKV